MPARTRIAVDATGGDCGPHVVVAASARFVRSYHTVDLTLVGVEPGLRKLLPASDRISYVDAEDAVTMSDRPAYALRKKQNSSMAKAIKLVAEGQAHACVSSGNTGALMGFGLKFLGTLPSVDRPAICKAVPSAIGNCFLLDLGANLSATAQQLLEFGVMGAAMARTAGIRQPGVGLLNVGREAEKGDGLRRDAFALMQNRSGLDFLGFMEGGDIYTGSADVIVCDGFTGNAVLKASEGVFQLLSSRLAGLFANGSHARVAGRVVKPFLDRWRTEHDPSSLNGAALLGLKGVVVKSHGSASSDGFLSALRVAYEQAENNMPSMIAAAMTDHPSREQSNNE